MTVAQYRSPACISKEPGFLPRRLQITEQVSLSRANMRYLQSEKIGGSVILHNFSFFCFFKYRGLADSSPSFFSARLKQKTKGSVERKWAVALAGCCFWPIVWFLHADILPFNVRQDPDNMLSCVLGGIVRILLCLLIASISWQLIRGDFPSAL